MILVKKIESATLTFILLRNLAYSIRHFGENSMTYGPHLVTHHAYYLRLLNALFVCVTLQAISLFTTTEQQSGHCPDPSFNLIHSILFPLMNKVPRYLNYPLRDELLPNSSVNTPHPSLRTLLDSHPGCFTMRSAEKPSNPYKTHCKLEVTARRCHFTSKEQKHIYEFHEFHIYEFQAYQLMYCASLQYITCLLAI